MVGDPTAKIARDVWLLAKKKTYQVVVERDRSSVPRTLRGAPHLRMSLCGLSIKRGHPPLSNIGQRPIFLNLPSIFFKVMDVHCQRDAVMWEPD